MNGHFCVKIEKIIFREYETILPSNLLNNNVMLTLGVLLAPDYNWCRVVTKSTRCDHRVDNKKSYLIKQIIISKTYRIRPPN